MKGMTILLMNGLGAFKYRQEDDISDRPRRQPWMAAENEFNDRMIIPEIFWCIRLIPLFAVIRLMLY